MRRLAFLAAVLALAVGQAALADTYTLTGDNTKVTFTGTKKNGKHDGGFKKLKGTVTADAADLSAMAVEVEIDTTSLWSDDERLTGHLKNPDFFAVKDHPTAKFKSTKVEKTDAGYTVTGDLTLLGKTKPVKLPVKAEVSGDTLTLKGETKIDRTAWGMSYGKGKVDDEVKLKVEVKAARK